MAVWSAGVMNEAERIFREHGGHLRMAQAVRLGITRRELYSLRDRGIIEQVSRGTYRLAELEPPGSPDLVTVGLRYPHAVVCLVSALSWHEITTQIPRTVSVAIPRNARPPKLEYPPLTVHRFSAEAFDAGVEDHDIDGVRVKIYSPEKTLADCFKFRNRLGMDVVLEALKLYRERRTFNLHKLLRYSRVCRVENVMRPYLEAQF